MKRILLFTGLLISLCTHAQDPNYSVIDKSKGLNSNAVYNLFQDSRGFIWASTDEGLSRYDGFQFRNYSHSKQTSKAGSEIHEDRFGRIWYENFDGYLYYVEHDSLKPLSQNKPAGYFNYGLSEQSLFVLQENGIDIYDLQSLKLRKTIPWNCAHIGSTIASGNLFYVNGDSLSSINDDGVVVPVSLPFGLAPAERGKMVDVGSGKLWLFGKTSLSRNCYQMQTGQCQELFSIGQDAFINTANLTGENTWFCTTSGCFAYDPTGKTIENGRLFFPGRSLSCVLKDRENNYWFSTTNEGILFVNDLRSRCYFKSFRPTVLELTGDELYFGTQNDEVQKANLNDMIPRTVYKGESNHSIDYLSAGDSFAPLFFSSDSFNYLNNHHSWRSESYSTKDCKPVAPGIYACAVSGYCGLFLLDDAPDSEWKHLAYGAPIPNLAASTLHPYVLLNGVRGKSVAWDSVSGTIYYASNRGLYAATVNGINELKNNENSVYASGLIFHNKTLYLLSTLGELWSINAQHQFTQINEQCGMPTDRLRRIRLCGNNLFLLGNNEISYVSLMNGIGEPNRISTYTTDIFDLVIWKNQILLTAPEGIVSIDFASEQAAVNQPLFVINSFYANNASLAPEVHSELVYEQNNVEVRYSILSFKTGSTYPLYYRINENEWDLCPADVRSLTLASLAPGTYEIQFRLGDASENRPVTVLNFSIDKPWWTKWWSIAGYIGVFMLGSYLIYKRQLTIQQRKNKLLTEKIELEKNLNSSILTSIKSQMNPHFFYNALNTIQSFIYANDKQNAGIYLSKFSRLTRMVLEMSEKEMISLQEETTACTLYLELEQVRFGDDFSFSIDQSEIRDPELTRFPSMIIQPYIENAVKHGLLHKKGEKKLSVTFTRVKNDLIVTIDDNGIGRQRSGELNAIRKDKHEPFSTQANQKRLELLNHGRKNILAVNIIDKKNEQGQPTGTTVIITIPVFHS